MKFIISTHATNIAKITIASFYTLFVYKASLVGYRKFLTCGNNMLFLALTPLIAPEVSGLAGERANFSDNKKEHILFALDAMITKIKLGSI